jgi:hypothetical protein
MIYNIHNILLIKSELDLFPSSFKTKNVNGKLDLIVSLKPNSYFEMQLQYYDEIMPGIYYLKEEDQMISVISIFGYKLLLSVQNLLRADHPTLVTMNNNYKLFTRKLLRVPLSSIFPLEHFLKLIVGTILHQKKATFVFCAGFSLRSKNFLIASFGSMGKTTLTLEIDKLETNDFKYLSDDTCIIFDGKVWGYPQDIRVRGKGFKFFHLEKFHPPSSVINSELISSFNPDHIVFLEHSEKYKKYSISDRVSVGKLHSVTNKIFPYGFERNLAALDYLYGFSVKHTNQTNILINECLSLPGTVIIGSGNYYIEQLKSMAE